MRYALANEVFTFLYSCLLGGVICVIFDFFRVIRICIKCHSVFVFIQDIIFFIITTVLISAFTVLLGDGNFRAFILFGVIIGFVLYFFTISLFLMNLLKRIVNAIKRLLKKLLNKIKSTKFFSKKPCNLK